MKITHPTNRPNFTELTINGLTVWFSYETPIAFKAEGVVVRKNDWGPTTGRHIGYVERMFDLDKRNRVNGNDFESQLKGYGYVESK